MRRILKYQMPSKVTIDAFQISMPKHAVLLKCDIQNNKIAFWYEVDDLNEIENNYYLALHTGDYLPSNNIIYINTLLFDDVNYVLHVYKLI